MRMIEKMACNTFKKTGNIDTFLEMKQMENIELGKENIDLTVNGEINGTNQNEGNCIGRK